MLHSNFIAALVFISMLGAPFKLWAHSFDIAVIAPFSNAHAQVGEFLWQGMRVATREADGHAFETSDGHLGGVDSNLLRFDSEQDSGLLTQKLREMGYHQGFIIAVVGPGQAALRHLMPQDVPHIVILTGEELVSAEPNLLAPSHLTGDAQKEFTTRFKQYNHTTVDDTALGGYSAARLIDAAIRQLKGDLTDSDAVRKSFVQALRRVEN